MYKLTTNLNMKEFPNAACTQDFTELDDLLNEIKESLIKTPDLKLTIEVEENE